MRKFEKLNKGIGIFVFVMIIIFGYKMIMSVSSITENEYPLQKKRHILRKEIITDKKEIEQKVKEYNLPEAPEKIVQIIDSNSVYIEGDEITNNEDLATPYEWGAQEIEFRNISKTVTRGELLRSSNYVAPGGSMTVSEGVEIGVSTSVSLSAEVISTEIGFNVSKSINISDTQEIKVPKGKTYICRAYVKVQKYNFEIWEDDVFFDDYLGKGTITKPIGVIFTITEK